MEKAPLGPLLSRELMGSAIFFSHGVATEVWVRRRGGGRRVPAHGKGECHHSILCMKLSWGRGLGKESSWMLKPTGGSVLDNKALTSLEASPTDGRVLDNVALTSLKASHTHPLFFTKREGMLTSQWRTVECQPHQAYDRPPAGTWGHEAGERARSQLGYSCPKCSMLGKFWKA